MKKIVYILATDHIAGTEIHLISLIEEIKSKYDITVISNGGEFAKKIKELGVKSKIINMNSRYSFKSILQLYLELKKEEYNIIHLHLPRSFLLGSIASKMYGKSKVLLTEHVWSSYNCDYNKIKNKIHLFIYKILTYFIDEIICVSDSVQVFLEKEVKIKKQKLQKIYNGSKNINDFEKKYNKFPTFGIVGRLSKEKGHIKLIEILAKLKNEEFKLKIFGKGELEEELKNKVKENKLEEKIEFCGFVENQKEIYSELDVVLLNSERECFPMVIVEAFKYRIPVISTNVGGVSEIVINDINGYLIESNNEDQYLKALKKILSLKLRKRMSENAQKIFLEKYKIEKMVKQVIEIYER